MTSKDRDSSGSRSRHKDALDEYLSRAEKETEMPGNREETAPAGPGTNRRRRFFTAAVFILLGFFLMRGVSNISFNPFSSIFQVVTSASPVSEDLLNRMNDRMIEMGYTGLSHEDLRDLRSKGVTATYISNVRALGFEELTLDQAVSLSQAGVTTTFLAMMLELGYDLSADEFVTLRRAGVTAHYTSNVHDLGYRDVTPEQLIRMRQIGVRTSLIEQLQQEHGEDLSMEEIIRYRISNQ
jgi:hypothetical protein